MLLHRVLTALVFAPALFGLVWWGGLPLQIATLGLVLLMLWEYLRLVMSEAGDLWTKGVAYALSLGVVAAIFDWLPGRTATWVLPLGTIVILTTSLVRPEPLERALVRVALCGLGVLYCAALLPYLARLRAVDDVGLGMALAALFCTWGADTGAYFAGRAFGRHKLYPKVSPGKTIEGLFGGILAAVAVAFIVREIIGFALPASYTVVLGVIAAVFGAVGDLCESLLKRSVGAKDSSQLIPGHGGVLDRFDGVIFVAPAVWIYWGMIG
ncbi:MAG: phosphatidate cytidylyltransferase [Myxococcota bacterium]